MIPESGDRFSDKIMLKAKYLDRDPIQSDRISVKSEEAKRAAQSPSGRMKSR
jgi:hypothetical protein